MTELKHSDLTKRILGVFYEVYNELGRGFLESVYENAMVIAIQETGLSVEQQKPITVSFRGNVVGEFRADLVVENSILLELKASKSINDAHIAQTLNYLQATSLEVALVLNFGPKPEFKRLVL